MRKIIRFCFEKVYKILRCIRFLLQDNVIESAKMNTEIQAIKRSLFELLQAKDNATQRLNNNPGSVRGSSNQHSKKKSNKCRRKNKASLVQSTICTSVRSDKIVYSKGRQTNENFLNLGGLGSTWRNSAFIETWDISCLTPDHMKKCFKICMERSCCKVRLSDEPITTNLCEYCKPKLGKSIDFYQFLTRANDRIQYFCGCIKCRNGNTSATKVLRIIYFSKDFG